MPDRIHELLNDWFGQPGLADMPNTNRTNMWFGSEDQHRKVLLQKFANLYEQAKKGDLDEWVESPRGRLALIILYDQFSRYLNAKSSNAFQFDEKAQKLCLSGIDKEMDKKLTLIERVFFYMPLVHTENERAQETSIRLYQELVSLSMPETTQVYQLFLAYAYAHFRVIKEFGRFPQRNKALNRQSTSEELAFLKDG